MSYSQSIIFYSAAVVAGGFLISKSIRRCEAGPFGLMLRSSERDIPKPLHKISQDWHDQLTIRLPDAEQGGLTLSPSVIHVRLLQPSMTGARYVNWQSLRKSTLLRQTHLARKSWLRIDIHLGVRQVSVYPPVCNNAHCTILCFGSMKLSRYAGPAQVQNATRLH